MIVEYTQLSNICNNEIPVMHEIAAGFGKEFG